MKFYNRKEEIMLLKEAVAKRPGLTLIRGRRRVGKTALILKVLKEENGIYLYVDPKKTEKALLAEFEDILRRELGLPEYAKVEKWETLYDIIFSHDKPVVIDEFQRLMEANSSAIYQLQNYWDTKGLNSKVHLILSGSNVGMIKKIFLAEGAPLFKRANFDMLIKPLQFSDCRTILNDLGITDIEEQIRVYAIAGGIPYYYVLLQDGKLKSWKDAAMKLLLNPLSPLKTEVKDTMVESFGKGHASYYAVINAIALGKTTKKEIADFSGISESSISPYLYDLENLIDVIAYEVPVTEKKGWKTKKGRFVLKDNLFRFWFTYVFRNMSYYEEGDYQYILKRISKDFETFVGQAFEQVAREFINKMNSSGKLPLRFAKIGRWWSRKGDEVDLVLLSEEENAIMLVECKWAKDANAEEILKRLKEKEPLMEHGKKKVYYGAVARGFKSKAEGILCYDIKEINGMLQ